MRVRCPGRRRHTSGFRHGEVQRDEQNCPREAAVFAVDTVANSQRKENSGRVKAFTYLKIDTRFQSHGYDRESIQALALG